MSLEDLQPHSPIIHEGIRGRLIPQVGATLQNNEHGLDVLVRPYRCRTSEVLGLIPKIGEPDITYPTLRMTDYTLTEGAGLMCDLMVTYKGLKDDKIPDVVMRGGWVEATVQLTTTTKEPRRIGQVTLVDDSPSLDDGMGNGEDPGDGNTDEDEEGEVSLTYRAPSTTIMYITRKRPRGPIYKGRMMEGTVTFDIVDVQPVRFPGRVLYHREIRTVSYTVDKVGAYYQCTEINQGFLSSRRVRSLFGVNLSVSSFPVTLQRG